MVFPFTMMQTVEKEDIVCNFSITEVLVTGIRSSESYHFHAFYELFTVSHGQMRLIADHQEMVLQPGDVCIIPPNVTHYVYEQADAFRVGFLFDFAPSKQGAKEQFFPAFQKVFGNLKNATVVHAAQMHDEYLKLIAHALETAEPSYVVGELLFLELDYVRRLLCPEESAGKMSFRRNDRFLAVSVERFMNTRYAGNPQIGELAQTLGFSVRQTQRILKRLFDMNFSQLLTKKRVSTACFLLSATRFSLEKIADMSGFCSVSHLSRHFKALVGMPPLQYRLRREQEHDTRG